MKDLLKEVFRVLIKTRGLMCLGKEVDAKVLLPIISGELLGDNMSGKVIPGGIKSHVLKTKGMCRMSARYGVELSDGEAIYIENTGLFMKNPKGSQLEDCFCRTVPKFEIYSDKYTWLIEGLFISKVDVIDDEEIIIIFYKI